jgi:nucleoside-diphosphate kinase
MERSLVLVKPDGVKRRLSGAIIDRLENLGLYLIAIKMLHPDKALAQRHYAVHQDKPFYDGLVDYISSGPIVACVFEGEQAVQVIRQAVGATDPAKAAKGTIRGDMGVDIERNTIHASDSPVTAAEETNLFFRKEEIFSTVKQ